MGLVNFQCVKIVSSSNLLWDG